MDKPCLLSDQGFAGIQLRICDFLTPEDVLSLSQVCTSIRRTIQSSVQCQLRFAQYIFKHPIDLDLSTASSLRPRQVLTEYVRRRMAQLALQPARLDRFDRHLLGYHRWRNGYLLSGVSKSRPDWNLEPPDGPWESDNWDGELFYEVSHVGRYPSSADDSSTSSSVGTPIANWRLVIPRRQDIAKAWDPLQNVLATVTHRVHGYPILGRQWPGIDEQQRGDLIPRLFALSPASGEKSSEAVEQSTAKYPSYRLLDQLVNGGVKIQLGPNGLVCWVLPSAVVLLDWVRGVWVGKYGCSPTDALFLRDGILAVLCHEQTGISHTISVQILDPAGTTLSGDHGPHAHIETLPSLEPITSYAILPSNRWSLSRELDVSFSARADMGRVTGHCAFGIHIDLEDGRRDRFVSGSFQHNARDRGIRSAMLGPSIVGETSLLKPTHCTIAGSAIYALSSRSAQPGEWVLRRRMSAREHAQIANFARSLDVVDVRHEPIHDLAVSGMADNHLPVLCRVVGPSTEVARDDDTIVNEIAIDIDPFWYPKRMEAGDGCLIIPLDTDDEVLGQEHNYDAKPVIVITF